MAHVLNDRVKETTTTTGTGTLNLAGAVSNFETFVAGIGNSNTTYYAIVHTTEAEFEVGLGTVTDASPDTLARTTIISSSNSDSAVDFSAGSKEVFCTMPASKAVVTVNGSTEIDFLSKIVDDINDSTVGTSKEVNLRGVANPTVTRRASSSQRSMVLAGNPIGYYHSNANYSNGGLRGRLHYVGDEVGDGTGTTFDAVLFYAGATNSSAHAVNIAIYTRNKYGWPSKRVYLASSTNPMASATGSKIITGDFTLKSGWYYVMTHILVASGSLSLRSNYNSATGHNYGRYSVGLNYSAGTTSFPTSAGDNSQVLGVNSVFTDTDPPTDLAVSGTNYTWFVTTLTPFVALRYKNTYSEDLTDA